MVGTRTRSTRRAWGVALGGVAMSVAVLASSAWACTAVMGKLTLNPTSGRAGSTVKAAATGLKVAPAKYRLVFIDSRELKADKGCHSSTSSDIIKRGIQTDSKGAFSAKAAIPTTAPRGTSLICGLETYPVRNQTATTHETYTVL